MAERADFYWLQPEGVKGISDGVRRTFGLALFAAQLGEMPPEAKPLKGFSGAGVLELIEDDKGGTYRAVSTVNSR